jgi:hypothetical protein
MHFEGPGVIDENKAISLIGPTLAPALTLAPASAPAPHAHPGLGV